MSTVEYMNDNHQQGPPPAGQTLGWSPQLLTRITNAPNLGTAARYLGAAGIPVFPCIPGGKKPLTPHGFQDATAERDVINSWWLRQPEANIGVPTGVAGGIDVVDVDVHPTGSGYAPFEQARRAGLVEGWAWLVRTPSGGLHAYFLRGADAVQGSQRSWQVPGKHVDFRGDGGYVIVPPSRVTTNDGRTRSYVQLAVASHRPQSVDAARLRALLDPPRQLRPPIDMPAAGTRPDRLAAWVASRPEGGRNGGLFWAACRMAEDGHDLTTTTSLLGEAAYAAGLPEREAMATIRSAYRIASRLGPPSTPTPGGPARPTNAVEAVGL